MLLVLLASCAVAASFVHRVSAGSSPIVSPEHLSFASAKQSPGYAYLQLPISFEAVDEPSQPEVKFKARGKGYSMSFTKTSIEMLLHKPESSRSEKETSPKIETQHNLSSFFQSPASIKMKLTRSDARAHISALDELPGKANYFIGNDPKKWQANIPTFRRLKYEGIYPGIDLLFYGNQRQVEYDFIISPGRDPKTIGIDFEGARGLSVDSEGNLIIETPAGQLRQPKPIAYQELDSGRESVVARYVLTSPGKVGFSVENYDREKPLVIDPILVYSTFLGGSDGDGATAISVDAGGNAYVTGWTYSLDFPTSTGSYQKTHGGGQRDVFITKINAAGTAVVYSTFLGGTSYEHSYGISVDPTGKLSVVGVTLSANFPITPGALQTTLRGSNTAFVTRFNETGSALEFSTYLGGPSFAYAAATDSAGNTYVTGATGPDFPITPGAFKTSPGDSFVGDAFVTKFSTSGSLVYSTFLGGRNGEAGMGIAVDASGNAYVTGNTNSDNFPVRSAYQGTLRGLRNAFISKLNSSGNALVYSTYFGGNQVDQGFAIAVDPSGNAVAAGETTSTTFPTTGGALRRSLGGPRDAFVTKLWSGGQLAYSTYLGGSGDDVAHGVAVDSSSGAAFIGGDTVSTDFPITSDAVQPTGGSNESNPRTDAFVTGLSYMGSLVYSTYLGGRENDRGAGVAIDSVGNILVTGDTGSPPGMVPSFPSKGGAQPYFGGGALDAFVVKLGEAVNNPTPTPTPTPGPTSTGNGKIAFVRNGHIYVMNPDGTNQSQLTDQSDVMPAWSPDGTKLAFSRFLTNGPGLFLVNADGTNPVQLTSAPQADGYPSWSPDGTQLMFLRRDQVYAIKADGTGLHRVSYTGDYESHPTWSPDGTMVALVSSRNSLNTIFVRDLNGENQRKLTSRTLYENWPAWSPDASKIAFSSGREIYVVNVDGTNVVKLTESVGLEDTQPVWSPDGKKIAFNRGGSSIWSMNIDGSNQVQLSNHGDSWPSWQRTAGNVGVNPIDDAQAFVQQHYRDFLSRDPDSAGWAHWSGEITACNDAAELQPGESQAACTERKRSNTSAAFFLSPEFQNTGSFVVRVYWGTLGKLPNAQCPGVPSGLPGQCRPLYGDYVADMNQIAKGIVVNDQLDPNVINANKQAFVQQFVNTTAFKSRYDGLSNQAFVDTLFQTTGINASVADRSTLVNGMADGAESRGSVVFKVVDGTTTQAGGSLVFNTTYGKAFYDKEFDVAFVFMEYIGYLRRNPDQAGFDHWLGKLKLYGNWSDAQMVLAFISSPEYRARFGQP